MRTNLAGWTALAAIVVVIVGPFAVFFLRDLSEAQNVGDAAKVFQYWQSLLGAILALVGAAAAAFLLIRQIDVARNLEYEKIKRRANALWSALPHSLSELDSYIQSANIAICTIIEEMKEHSQNHVNGILINKKVNLPAPPANFILHVQNIIEVCEASEVRMLSMCSIWTQIQNARLSDLIDSANGAGDTIYTRYNVISAAIDLAEIRYYYNTLISYARSSRKPIPDSINAQAVSHNLRDLLWKNVDYDAINTQAAPMIAARSEAVYQNDMNIFDRDVRY